MSPTHRLLLHRRRVALAGSAIALVLAVGLASCGVAGEKGAHRIEPRDVPFGLLDDQPTTTGVAAGRSTSIYLLTKERLVPVQRPVPDDVKLEDLLALVMDGPTEVEQSLGITSAVPSGTVSSVTTSRGVAKVDLSAAFGDIRSRDQLRAVAQIVYTLTGQPGIGGVRFSVEGKPVAVPLADGTRASDALSRDDFASMKPR